MQISLQCNSPALLPPPAYTAISGQLPPTYLCCCTRGCAQSTGKSCWDAQGNTNNDLHFHPLLHCSLYSHSGAWIDCMHQNYGNWAGSFMGFRYNEDMRYSLMVDLSHWLPLVCHWLDWGFRSGKPWSAMKFTGWKSQSSVCPSS